MTMVTEALPKSLRKQTPHKIVGTKVVRTLGRGRPLDMDVRVSASDDFEK